jgi:hypothetical protein
MKRFFIAILILLICGAMLSGCGISISGNNKNYPEVTAADQPAFRQDVSQNKDNPAITSANQPTELPAESEKSIPAPVAYISIDINPSIELGVDSIDNVVTAEACNEDGEKVLSACNVLGLNVKEAVKLLVAEASSQGFIAADGSSVISITTETLDKNKAENLKKLSEEGASEALDDCGDCASVYKDNIEFSIREEAKSLGISTGKLILVKKLMALDPTATVEQYKNAKISEIIAKIKALSGDTYKSLMNDDVDCTDGCMDDCSCIDCSDCNDDHCDAECSDGCIEMCICTDCEDCDENLVNGSGDVACADDCKDCSETGNVSGKPVDLDTTKDQLEDAADQAIDDYEEKLDREMD